MSSGAIPLLSRDSFWKCKVSTARWGGRAGGGVNGRARCNGAAATIMDGIALKCDLHSFSLTLLVSENVITDRRDLRFRYAPRPRA